MNDRQPFFVIFAILVIVAAVGNIAYIYAIAELPRQTIQAVVEKPESKASKIVRPKISLDTAFRRSDIAVVKQHMYWCMKSGSCNLNKDLHAAVTATDPAITRIVLAAGADVNATGEGDETALHSAVTTGRTGAALVLIQAGAEVNRRDSRGMTPLHTAAGWGHVQLTRLLLDSGADVNALDNDGQTPLHLVASRPVPPLSVYADVAKMLIDAGARTNVKGADGASPLELAKNSATRLSLDGNLKAAGDANEVANLLRERGNRR